MELSKIFDKALTILLDVVFVVVAYALTRYIVRYQRRYKKTPATKLEKRLALTFCISIMSLAFALVLHLGSYHFAALISVAFVASLIALGDVYGVDAKLTVKEREDYILEVVHRESEAKKHDNGW